MHNNEEVTVDEAITRGRWMILYPLIVLFVVIPMLYILVLYLEIGPAAWVGPIGFLLIILLPTLYAGVMTTRWRIWAFSHVRNVHDLRERAILAQLMHREGSFGAKLEIKTASQKEQLAILKQKFEQPDVFTDDPEVPFETVFQYSSKDKVNNTLFSVVCFVIATFLFVYHQVAPGIFVFLAGAVFFWSAMRLDPSRPVLTLNSEGITTSEHGFARWEDIKNEIVDVVGNASGFMSYEAGDKRIEISLLNMGTTGRKVYHLLKIYRGRHARTHGYGTNRQ